MGDVNHIPTLRDYSKSSHKGFRNTIELPVGNNGREEINDRMAEMFGLLKELTTSRAPKNMLIREEAKSPVTKNVNSISLTRKEEERNGDNDVVTGDDIKKTTRTEMEVSVKEVETKNGAENSTKNKPIKEERNQKPVKVVLPKISLSRIHKRTKQEFVSSKMCLLRQFDRHPQQEQKEEAKEQYKEEDEMGTAEEVKELSEDEESKKETE
ncbi:hypothetical protein Tco_1015056 [Tanacetum coccineum]|uniref:Uncharacterized protein n=1 Tax=Tanacetum coccineum TaxID=301880 RepID=A0ABQ5FJN9_9ASTR